jgi:dihydrofolate reductase
MSKPVYIIAAADPKNGIGIKGKLPWNLKKDLAYFQKRTIKTDDANKRNMVIMGRTTWLSLPEAARPLPGRKNVVLSHEKDLKAPNATVVYSMEEAMEQADERIESIFIIGGAKVYEQAISRKDVKGIYLTRIKKEFKCDTFFPKMPNSFKLKKTKENEENGLKFEFQYFERG